MRKKILSAMLIIMIGFAGCDYLEIEEKGNVSDVELSVAGIKPLADSLVYAAWISYTNEKNVLVNSFLREIEVNESGNASLKFFVSFNLLQRASDFLITIELKGKIDSAKPKGSSIVSGKFTSNTADLSSRNSIGAFANSFVKYNLATPTDGNDNTDEKSGIWFVDSVARPAGPVSGLKLPVLGAGWNYEAWVELNGQYVSLGKFKDGSKADKANPYSLAGAPYNFPGEDLLANAPAGLTFPVDLSGKKVLISLQPEIVKVNNSPFYLLVAEGTIPADVQARVTYSMQVVNSFPSGFAKIVVQ